MIITQTAAPVVAAAPPVRLQAGAETAAAVAAPSAGAGADADADNDPARRDSGAAALPPFMPPLMPPALDPDAPVGPPPAFRANVLEAERARLREGRPGRGDERPADDPRIAGAPPPGMAEAGTAYGGRPPPAPGLLDLVR